jgi:phospholipid transport system substrate-binding protein
MENNTMSIKSSAEPGVRNTRATGRFAAPRFMATALALAGAMLLLLAAERPVQAADTAMSATRTMVNHALRIIANGSMPLTQRQHQLRALVEPNLDFTQMSRSALGYHWRTLDPAQRAAFTTAFRGFIEDAYLAKLRDYSGQQVEFIREVPLGQGYSEVDTNIVQPGKNSIPVSYLLERSDGGWKIYDITVDRISIVANYRNQFNRVINEHGFDKLMADLRVKQQQLSATLGSG